MKNTNGYDHSETYGAMQSAIKDAGMKSWALVAVDENGEVFWGANYGFKANALLKHLRIIEGDIKSTLKRYPDFA